MHAEDAFLQYLLRMLKQYYFSHTWEILVCENYLTFPLEKYFAMLIHSFLALLCREFAYRIISNFLFVFNGLSSNTWTGNFRYFKDKLLAFPHTREYFVLLLMVLDKLVPKHSVDEYVLCIDIELGASWVFETTSMKAVYTS